MNLLTAFLVVALPGAYAQCTTAHVCDTFASTGTLSGSSCADNLWTGPWTLMGDTQQVAGAIKLQEHRVNTAMTRYVDLSATVNMTYVTVAVTWGTEAVEINDETQLWATSDGGSTWTSVHSFVGLPDTLGAVGGTVTVDAGCPS